jgi:hypothetical protein
MSPPETGTENLFEAWTRNSGQGLIFARVWRRPD